MYRAKFAHAVGAMLLASATAALAQEPQLSDLPWEHGPGTGTLGELATLKVPEGYAFLPKGPASQFMAMMGNPSDGSELGVLVRPLDDQWWFAVFEFDESGYVKDEDQDSIDADAILDSIKEGTEASNEARKQMGSSPMHIVGWFEKPNYNGETKNLEWAIHAQSESGDERVDIVNHNVRILGRRGVLEATLVDGPATLATSIGEFRSVLKDLSYNEGERYADFREGDKIAAYGLAALIAGGAAAAAAKSGFLAKFGKAILFGGIAILAGLGTWFKNLLARRKTTPA